KELKEKNKKCKCIRCREARENIEDINKAKLFEEKYRASKGTEYFISYESKNRDKLYSFIRFRVNDSKDNFIPELKNAALVREIHTYGQLVPVDSKKSNIQHIGFGKRLMKIAEDKAKELGYNKIAVISGIGVRLYYEKLGYSLEGTYMIKYLH
ncbi:GNAT family N-acetyltransferase, partial [bacterium]|nr:GNAT family N-acetyltransferase [bacterium]